MQTDTSQVNNKKLYVGNLPYQTTEDELNSLFGQYGELTNVTLITDKMSGRSKGFGFVEFANEEDAGKAVEALQGYELNGRALIVNVARPFQPGKSRSGGGGGFRPRYGRDNGGGRMDRHDRMDRAA